MKNRHFAGPAALAWSRPARSRSSPTRWTPSREDALRHSLRAPIALDRADAVINAALGTARSHDWKLICAVVDSGANLVALKRMDGAQLASIAIAEHKARAAAKFRRETKAFEGGVQGGLNYQLTLDDVIASRGGIPLVDNGRLVGAIGCSGGTGSQDEVGAKAGAAALR